MNILLQVNESKLWMIIVDPWCMKYPERQAILFIKLIHKPGHIVRLNA